MRFRNIEPVVSASLSLILNSLHAERHGHHEGQSSTTPTEDIIAGPFRGFDLRLRRRKGDTKGVVAVPHTHHF